MQLTAEVKYDGYDDLPRQQEVAYANSANTYLKADASTGKHYYDLNAASKGYSGPWLFGKQKVEVNVNGMRGQWIQWCPVPADIRDGVLMRGNVIYQNSDGSYRMSPDVYEGVVESEHGFEGGRYFVGRTQHTFYSRNLPGGQMKVVANLRIHLDQRLPYNPMSGGGSGNGGSGSGGGGTAAYDSQGAAASYSSYDSGQVVAPPQGTETVPTTSEGASGSDSGF